ncbi:winged helix DNA-binding domain-containing protein [Lentzea tibetensis]|uniref:Winged helix DNA-binding domain-containing protein n=1 Tax=Lentzea tibetensis TaxID=2591470 RepID=A0A563ENF8_9PSEU|nr:winged helix DNA-binding domain-containing protein [Lentzea tibetensis]TWP48796.1 winged helix DNA-binding domain-containing protein [Lentzea tibetensis]
MGILSRDALNRALIERQMLRERAPLGALDAIEHLVGIQAQEPPSPYPGLWSRLQNFRADDLTALLESRQAVRLLLMRGTIHLVSAADCLGLRPLVQVILDRHAATPMIMKKLVGLDVPEVVETARVLMEERPDTLTNIGKQLAEKWPGYDPTTFGLLLRCALPAVQLPPRGTWGPGLMKRPVCTTSDAWLGRPLESFSIDDVVLRYLAAFGPSSVMDVQAWCGLTRLREVLDRLRDRLVVFTDESGRELFDLPDAPRPDEDTPLPVRFIPEFDNILLAHADRSRVIADKDLPLVIGGKRTVLINGYVGAQWTLTRTKDSATLAVEYLAEPEERVRDEVTEEAERLLAFLAPDVERTVR